MNRIFILSTILVRDLFLSMSGIVPLAAALAFGLIAFEYGMDQAQFITVGGVGTLVLCFLTTLLLASRANRASTYLVLARLHRRAELLASLILASFSISVLLAILIALGNLLTGRLILELPATYWIPPSWSPLLLLAASLGLALSGLVARGGSHLVGYLLLAGLLVANEQSALLADRGLTWLARAVAAAIWPVSTLLAHASAGSLDGAYFLAGALTLGYAILLYLLAALLFQDKDLCWSE
jgi:hypothetical protein